MNADIEPEARPRQFARLRLRSALGLGVVLLGVMVIAFASGRLRASRNQVAEAAGPPADSLSHAPTSSLGRAKFRVGAGLPGLLAEYPYR